MKVDFSRSSSTDADANLGLAHVDLAAALKNALNGLTEIQKSAVEAPAQPLLILAGAGTGKTKCLVARIAHKIAAGERLPSQILAVTFTRKAAAQMKRRLGDMIGPTAIAMDIGTFHAICARMLRDNAEFAGLNPEFTVLDSDDQRALMRQIALPLKAQSDEKISVDDLLKDVESYKTEALMGGGPWAVTREPSPMTLSYIAAQEQAQAIDYTDIIIKAIELLQNHSGVRAWYRQTWPSVLVDEYQDANPLQELWLDLLAPPDSKPDLTCVGDDDQSIYKFRDADIKNILEFAKKRPAAAIIRLEQNFRSTSDILDHANRIIAHNVSRHGKTLYTIKPSKSAVTILTGKNAPDTEYDEADLIVAKIQQLIAKGAPLGEIAVITRTAMPLMGIQARLATRQIPFTVTAGRKFTETAEIRQIVSYMRLMMNPNDDLAFLTALNSKTRGFGKTTQGAAITASKSTSTPLYYLLKQWMAEGRYKGVKLEGLQEFFAFIEALNGRWDMGHALKDLIASIETEVGITERIATLREKAGAAKTREDERKFTKQADQTRMRLDQFYLAAQDAENFEEFIDSMTLSDIAEDESTAVWLGTIHGAKGLEFDHVFLPAWEPGILPPRPYPPNTTGNADFDHERHKEWEDNIEEERRLAYVAVTRARQSVQISHCRTPRDYLAGRQISPGAQNRSPFIDQILT